MLATTEGERPILIVRDAWLLDLGRRPYREVWEWQKSLVDLRADDRIPDGLILVEHEPIATLGRRGKREDVLDPSLEIVEVERGGEATYLREFLRIRPCGHDGGIMTSMAESLGRGIDLEDVKASVIAHFQGVFGFTLRRVDVSELLRERPADQKRRRP